MWFSDLHEKHELDDWRSPQKFTEGVDKEVVGQQYQLDQQHQWVVAGLKHLHKPDPTFH